MLDHPGSEGPRRWALPAVIAVHLAALAVASGAEEIPPAPGEGKQAPASEEGARGRSPWAFSLGLYTWLPSIDADLTSGNLESSVEESLFDILDATKGIPLSLGGRFEARWRRLGLCVDANYFNLRFREQDVTVGNVLTATASVTTQMTFLEYSAMFRVFGPPAGDLPAWAVESAPPRVDLYAGGRTIWLKNEIEPANLPDSSNDEVLTSPLVGVRAEFDLGPKWFFRLDGNVGGFGVDDVDFVTEGLAAFGFRMTPFHVATEIWAGYQVLYLEVASGGALGRLESETLLHGPTLGLTFAF